MGWAQVASGWWSNKPPMHRRLLLIGIGSSGVLVCAGLLADSFGETGSGFAGYLWSLATAVTVGTIGLAVVEDVRSWGVSWRALKAEEGPLLRNVGDLMRLVAAPLGVRGHWSKPLSLADARDQLTLLSRPMSAATYAYWKHSRSRLNGDEVVLPNPFEDWHALSQCLDTAGTFLDLPQTLDADLEKELEREVASFATAVGRITLGLSTGAQNVIGVVEMELAALPKQVMTAATILQDLKGGRPIDADHLERSLSAVQLEIQRLGLAVELVEYEMKTGTPHPFYG